MSSGISLATVNVDDDKSRDMSRDMSLDSISLDPQDPKTSDLLAAVEASDLRDDSTIKKLDVVIQEKFLRDRSPEAKARRRRMYLRAAYGEFMCTLLFFTPIFSVIANATLSGWMPELTTVAMALVAGFQAIGVSFAFSSVSGAQFNPAISFALWLTGKLSNRRCLLYICVQFAASIVGMVIVACIFNGNLSQAYDAIAVTPVDDNELGKVFATEFFLTFFLTYVAFTVAFEDAEVQKKESMSFQTISDTKGLTLYASTPQSKTGFAPFSIGFAIFALCLTGGTSGGAFNPARLLGPALFSGKYDYIYLYWIGEFLGAACAGLLVNNMHRIGLEPIRKDEVSAKDTLDKALAQQGKVPRTKKAIPTTNVVANPMVK